MGDAPTDRLGVLLTLGKLLTQAIDLDVLLRRMIDLICQAIACDRGTIYLVDRAQGVLRSRVAHLDEIKEIVVQIGQGVAGYVAKTGEIVNTPDAQADERVHRLIDERTGYVTRSMLTAPLRDRTSEIIGVMQLLNKTGGPFTAADEEFVEALASQAAIVIENTSLYRQLRSRAAGSIAEELRPALDYRFNHVVGSCEPMRRVYDAVLKAAPTDATILIKGESGTGKDLIARAIHANSPRSDRPLVKVDCAAIPETLIENELFGHEKGAFTGADRRMPGKCETAADGTLFVDEISELPLPVQGKLLRVLQDREFELLGGSETKPLHARIVAATNRDLQAQVADGKFRTDLYYRIKVVEIPVPPLRERGRADIVELAGYFLDRFVRKYRRPEMRLTPPAVERLVAYEWPGNVRELEHCVESAVVLADGLEIGPAELPLPSSKSQTPAAAAGNGDIFRALADVPTLDELDKRYIQHILKKVGGNRSEAARILGIGRNTLWRKIKSFSPHAEAEPQDAEDEEAPPTGA